MTIRTGSGSALGDNLDHAVNSIVLGTTTLPITTIGGRHHA